MSPKTSCKLRDHVEAYKIHWVANLPDHEFHLILDRLIEVCPKDIEGIALDKQQLRKHLVYTGVLIPIVMADGSISQEEEFQDLLKDLKLNAYKISNILEDHYRYIKNRQSSLATA